MRHVVVDKATAKGSSMSKMPIVFESFVKFGRIGDCMLC